MRPVVTAVAWSVCLSVGLSVCLSVSPHAETCRCPTAPVQVRVIRCGLLLQVWRGLSVCPSVSLAVFLSLCLSVCWSICLSVWRLQLVLVRCSGCVCRDVFGQLLCVVSVAAPSVSSCSLFRLCAKSFCISDHLDKHPVM